METTPTNSQLAAKPAAAEKKTWASPSLEVIDRGYVEGGAVTLINEASTVTGNHGTHS